MSLSKPKHIPNPGPNIFRHDQRRSPQPGGARVPHAEPAGLPPSPLRDHAGVLAQGPHEAADLRDPPVAAGRLLYPV
jgi:hypothetical protein